MTVLGDRFHLIFAATKPLMTGRVRQQKSSELRHSEKGDSNSSLQELAFVRLNLPMLHVLRGLFEQFNQEKAVIRQNLDLLGLLLFRGVLSYL